MDLISRQAAIDALGQEGLITAMVIVDRLPSVQPETHGVCMDCLMKNVCRFKIGLGDYGYCSQWKGAYNE